MSNQDTVVDLRELPPPQRHPRVYDAFEALDSGETLTIVNDHDPQPLFYQMSAELDAFDAENYVVERTGLHEFTARLPKK